MATYRVQLNKEFDFNKLKTVIPYLAELGISHIYASPILKARHGSTHGYDVTDYGRINDELGGRKAFEDLIKEAAAYGLGWIQDIVPNHAAYSAENGMISDIMKCGSDSKYYRFFDVDWNHPSPGLRNRIIAPFLEDTYENCLKRGEMKLGYHRGFIVRYKGMEFPIKLSSYKPILQTRHHAALFPAQNKGTFGSRMKKRSNPDGISTESIQEAVGRYNCDVSLLDRLLSAQVFALSDWRTASKKINYRRFFDIIDMICLRTEELAVFEATHGLMLKLVSEGKISGLRVDHIDGLHNPEEYLKRLREKAGNAYVIVEKILSRDERLPNSWPVQGTTGYDFLNRINELFVDAKAEKEFNGICQRFVGKTEPYDELLYKCKKRVIREYFGGDVDNLTRFLCQALRKMPFGENYDTKMLREAIMEVLSCFPVYRTYLAGGKSEKEERASFRSALLLSKRRNKKVEHELTILERLLEESMRSQDALGFFMRLQQFSGVIMAKGFEDTMLYVYNRFISLNEVGGTPQRFGGAPQDFHDFNSKRQNLWPLSMNTTSTHDTKRGEDVRARLNVLSEIPTEFDLQIRRWHEVNRRKKKRINGKPVPSPNEEFYVYQTLLGAFPFDTALMPEFAERLKVQVVKAAREAKANTSWLKPNSRYEEALVAFMTQLLDTESGFGFLQQFLPFQQKIVWYGCINSLAQTLLKMTSPGLPDFYQGTELWDLSLVDPDNRRPVDFIKRRHFLAQVAALEGKSAEIQALLYGFEDGRVKLYIIQKSLAFRRRKKELFEAGKYIPLEVRGTRRNHIIAFCRRNRNDFALTVVPRFLSGLGNAGSLVTDEAWKDTHVRLPVSAPRQWREIFTGVRFRSRKLEGHEALPVSEMLSEFPVALLTSDDAVI